MVIIIPGNSSRHQANSSSNCVASLCLVSTSAFAFVIKAASAATTPTSLTPLPLPSSQLLLCLHNMSMSMTLFASQPRRRLATRMRRAPFRPGHAPWQERGQGQWVLGCRTTRTEAKFASLVLPAKISKNERSNLRYAHPALWSGIYISSERTTSCRYYTVDTHTHSHTHPHSHTYVCK